MNTTDTTIIILESSWCVLVGWPWWNNKWNRRKVKFVLYQQWKKSKLHFTIGKSYIIYIHTS